MRHHPVTLRHALLSASRTYTTEKYDNDGQDTAALTAIATLIMDMWDITWTEDAYEPITEVITGTISLEAGMAMLNAFARRQAELANNSR